MQRAKFMITLSLALACRSPGPRTSPQPVTAAPATRVISMPARVGRYSLGETHCYDDPAQGAFYRYSAGDRTRVTAFVYPIPADVRVEDDPQTWVTKEGEKFAKTFPIGVQRGWYEDFKVAFATPEPLDAAGSKIPGFAAAVPAREHGEVVVEMEYVYLVQGQFLKVRGSIPGDGWQSSDVPRFAKSLAAMLVTPSHDAPESRCSRTRSSE